MVGVTGVIVDGSNAFAQRRQMQNAADAAALAGARALDRLATGAEGAIWTAVVASATSNGADALDVTCRLETDVLVDLGACPTAATDTATSLRNAASAVHVTVGAVKTTSFIRVVGIQRLHRARERHSADRRTARRATRRSPCARSATPTRGRSVTAKRRRSSCPTTR